MAVHHNLSELPIVFDTGSSNLWIYSKECERHPDRQSVACQGHALFDADSSSTLRSKTSSLHIKYGGGQIQAHRASDVVSIAESGLRVENQSLGLTFFARGSFGRGDGILGLAFPSLSKASDVPFFDNLLRLKRVDRPEFTFFLSGQPGSKSSKVQVLVAVAGPVTNSVLQLWVGSYDGTASEGSTRWHQVQPGAHDYWSVS